MPESDEGVATGPVYFLAIPELAYKALSDAAAKKNMTLAQVVATALSEYLKNNGGV
jgi:hypothetical protein